MARVVYVGGFGNGRASAEGVAEALEKHYEDVVPFTFSDYIRSPEAVRSASEKADLITHSAGALAIADAGVKPNKAELLNPPLPRNVASLIARTVLKQGRMVMPGMGIQSLGDLGSVVGYNASSIAELTRHPVANLGNLTRIAGFDSVNAAIQAQLAGVHSRLTWTHDDAYFMPSMANINALYSVGLRARLVPGEHDEVAIRPGEFIDKLVNSDNPNYRDLFI